MVRRAAERREALAGFSDLELYEELRSRGVGLMAIGREDAEGVWREELGEDAGFGEAEWAAVRGTRAWREGFGNDALREAVWDVVRDAVAEAVGALGRRGGG